MNDEPLATSAPALAGEDPHQWLEEVEGARAMRWVAARNQSTMRDWAERPAFATLRERLRQAFDSQDRIPHIDKIGDRYYNFWRDLEHPRGLWRRTTLTEYRQANPKWELVLDLDEVARREGENWVLKGFDCRQPDYQRCLVRLSRGGADAVVVREFDLASRTFVGAADGGFTLPEAKGSVAWAGPDSVFVATDFGPGSLTESGYPRIVKLWRRGQTLAQAELVLEGEATDVSVSAWTNLAPGHEVQLVWRARDFHTSDVFVRRPGGALVPLGKPADAGFSIHRGRLFLELKSDWSVGQVTYAAGSLLVADLRAFLAEPTNPQTLEVLFAPAADRFLAGYAATRDHVLINILDNVRSRVVVASATDGTTGWTKRPLFGAVELDEGPARELGKALAIRVEPVDADGDNRYFAHVHDYLTPPTFAIGEVNGELETLKQAPARFNASELTIDQHWARSADGTRVPYFQVGPADAGTGPRRTLLYGYGGFEIPLLPAYSPGVGIGWLQRGGVYVVANIRGGGEFGPVWHRTALRENRQLAYEDFIAVAEDLTRRGVATSDRLGILGGSNGGLLTGNMLTMRPDLFGAVVSMVPLMDMRRYHRLLAGASWIAEFGNPDDPDDWRFLQRYSPYHNIRDGDDYPPTLITTSTRDDRVHPGHARKMAARMREMGHDVTYYENTEGGHEGSANNAQTALIWSLIYEFLWRRLRG